MKPYSSSSFPPQRVIYDFGAHRGEDVDYYLNYADKVVLVEANPSLCEYLRSRYRSAINDGVVVVVNACVSSHSGTTLPFYLHKTQSALCRFSVPDNFLKDYELIHVRAVTPVELVNEYGIPFYIKIDVEGCDELVLRNLFDNKIFPDYISVEIHTLSVVALLLECPEYLGFKLVEGYSVFFKYALCRLKMGTTRSLFYSFPYDSAGPFGDDIFGRWLNSRSILIAISSYGLGWRDLHASRCRHGRDMTGFAWLFSPYEPYLLKFLSRLFRFFQRLSS
jgi:FkbM family methyltransferase